MSVRQEDKLQNRIQLKLFTDYLMSWMREIIGKNINNHKKINRPKRSNICQFQLLKCDDLQLFDSFISFKIKYVGFWTIGRTKKKRHLKMSTVHFDGHFSQQLIKKQKIGVHFSPDTAVYSM